MFPCATLTQRNIPSVSTRNFVASPLSLSAHSSFCTGKENEARERASMSAPIDDLLYGGDDSGDEDEMNSTSARVSSLCPPSSCL